MLNKNKAFYLDDTPTMPGKYIMRVNHENFYCHGTNGSYNVLPARLLGISYADFLRLCRDVCGAELYGKNCLYVVPYFTLNDESKALVDLLNGIADLIITKKNNPAWQEQQKFVEQYYDAYAKEFNALTKQDIDSLINHDE